jgi:hypothetical protein
VRLLLGELADREAVKVRSLQVLRALAAVAAGQLTAVSAGDVNRYLDAALQDLQQLHEPWVPSVAPAQARQEALGVLAAQSKEKYKQYFGDLDDPDYVARMERVAEWIEAGGAIA